MRAGGQTCSPSQMYVHYSQVLWLVSACFRVSYNPFNQMCLMNMMMPLSPINTEIETNKHSKSVNLGTLLYAYPPKIRAIIAMQIVDKDG